MKKWIALICCFVCTVGLMISGLVGNRQVGVISRLEKAMNRNDQQAFVECFLPEEREAAEVAFGLLGLAELPEGGLYSVRLLQGDKRQISENEKEVDIIMTGYNGLECEGAGKETLIVIRQDGKEYIKGGK